MLLRRLHWRTKYKPKHKKESECKMFFDEVKKKSSVLERRKKLYAAQYTDT
jgi:hypothetical protein